MTPASFRLMFLRVFTWDWILCRLRWRAMDIRPQPKMSTPRFLPYFLAQLPPVQYPWEASRWKKDSRSNHALLANPLTRSWRYGVREEFFARALIDKGDQL